MSTLTAPSDSGKRDGRPSAARQSAASIIDVALRYAPVIVLVVLLIVATILVGDFWAIGNLKNIVSQNTPIGLVAIAVTVIIITANFDLSVGAIFAAGAVFYASVADEWPLEIGLIATLGVGAMFGAINGLIVTRLGVNSLIATLGTGAAFSGVTYLYCNNSAIQVNVSGFDGLGLGEIAGIPWTGVVLFAAFVIVGVILARSVYGRRVYAVGGSAEAARLAGMRVNAIIVSAFVLVGLASAFGGAILASQIGVGQPTIGTTTALDAFAIVVIGGTSIYGGEGAIWRTATGLAILSVLSNVFNSLTLDPAVQSIAKGAILIAALGLDRLAQRRRS